MTSSIGSTLLAILSSFVSNPFTAASTTSSTAFVITFNSASASSENFIFFSYSSFAERMMLTAWSEIRSKSPMQCNIIDKSWLSFTFKSF